MTTTDSQSEPRDQPPDASDFIAELRHWRDVRGLSQTALGDQMGYDRTYVSKIEGGQQRPTRAFATRADEILDTAGALLRKWRAYDSARRSSGSVNARPVTGHDEPDAASASLVVRHEDTHLAYDNGAYHLRIRRQLFNQGTVPVSRYLIRVSVDRHPEDPALSNELYRTRPLTLDELGLVAACEGEAMDTCVQHNHDKFKEIWLLLENRNGKFPLYPCETVWIEYEYTVTADKWGKWLQRTIRHSTERLSVALSFPADLETSVWGTESSLSAAEMPLRSAIERREEEDRHVYCWSVDRPSDHTRFRFEWRFKAGVDDDLLHKAPSERMREIGIAQRGDSILGEPAARFDLPAEADDARETCETLLAYLAPIKAAHAFGKGVGLAAPQIGVPRAAAVVEPPGGEPVVLFNPRVIDASPETDEQYEGCLSLFDVRGVVSRPLRIEVEHMDLDGQLRIAVFEHGAARLWAHEIDHLNGLLYTDRMDPEIAPIPVERYESAGEKWRYE